MWLSLMKPITLRPGAQPHDLARPDQGQDHAAGRSDRGTPN